MLVYPDLPLAKVYRLRDGQYLKAGDFSEGQFTFDLGNCQAECNFGRIFSVPSR